MGQMMNSEYQSAALQHQQMMMMNQAEWSRAQQEMQVHEWRMQQEFEHLKIAEQAQSWKNEMAMNEQFDASKLAVEDEQRNILNSSNSMLEVMMNDPDPRFQNSEFLHFLKRINKGELVIQGKEIKEVKEDTETLDKAWNEAELIHQSNQAMLDPAFQQAKAREAE